DTNGAWRINGGVGFTFPTNTTLSAGGRLVLVNFDPADAPLLDNFRARYSLSDSAVAIFGPYTGKLGNRSDRIALEKPQYPDLPGEPYSWVIVDEVIYGNQSPWPIAANGSGSSLERTDIGGSGNNPLNWKAAAPTPGRDAVADRDGDGMADDWEAAHQLNPDDPTDADLDSGKDGFTNLQEYLAGTDPRDSWSALRFESAALSQGAVVLGFIAAAGKSYSVIYRDSAAGGGWLKLKNILPSPMTGWAEVTDGPPAARSERY